MTSRGNQSVSPPAQISQQRHVNVISSSTPPPQQYYQGSSPALPQLAYEFLTPQAQGQAYSPYQAYGNAINDIRGQPGNGGRAGPLQQSLSQGGGYYQQHGPSMRPQQIQQAPQASQQYYIGHQSPGTFRPAQPSPQQMLYYQNYSSGSNVYTIPANMFTGPTPTVPMYQQSPFMQSPAYQAPVMCYPNGTQWRNQVMAPTGPSYIRPQVREKKVLNITDPDTGRNITEEIFSHRIHPADSDDPYEQVPQVSQNNIEIRQTFTRMVADRLKSPDEPGLSGPLPDSQGAIGGAASSASQQYQLPPQQHMQQSAAKGPAPLMRPPMNGPPPAMSHQMMPARPGSSQQPPASVTPPQEIPHQIHQLNIPNLSMPPPQLPGRAPNQAVYNPTPQQPQHVPHPHLSQTPPQQQQQQPQPVRQHMPPAMPTPLQQVQLQAQQSPHHLPSHQPLLNQIPHAPQNQSPPYNQMTAPGMPANPALHQISSGMGVNPPAGQHIPSTSVGTNPAGQQIVSNQPINPVGQQIVSNQPINPVGQQIVSNQPINPVGQQIVSNLPVNPAGQQIVSNLPAKTASQPVNQLDLVEKPKQQVEVVPQNNIPAKLAGPPVSSPVAKTAPSVKELSPAPTPTEQAGDVKSPPPTKTVASFNKEELVAEKTEDSSKEESSQGANAQGIKDGRKGKRNWKINRKDVSGSDMDAFTDNVEETNSEAGENRPHNAQETEPTVNGADGHQVPVRQASVEEYETKLPMDTSRGPEITWKDSTLPQKDSTPPQKESTPPQKESTLPQKESTPSHKDRTPPRKVSTPTVKDRTPTPDSPSAVPLDNRYSKDKDSSHTLKHQDSKDKDSSHTLKHQDFKDKDSSHTLKHQDSKDKDSSHTLKHKDKDSSHSLKHQDFKDKDSSHTLKHQDSKDKDSSHTLKHQDSKDKDSSHTLKHQDSKDKDSQKSAAAVLQVESKYKQKKKKKKGHHSPPNQKSKQSSPTDTTEKQSNAVETDSKSSIASSVTDDNSKDSKGQATAPPDSPAALRDTFTVPDAEAPPALPSTQQEPAKVTDIVQPPPHQLPEASPSLQQPELVKDHTRHSSSPEESTILKEAIHTTIITASKLDSSSKAENHKAIELPASSIQNISEHFDQPVDSSFQEEPSAAESVQTGESVRDSSFVNHRIAEQNEALEYIVRPETESKKEYVSDVDGETVSLRPQSERTVSRVRKDGRLQYDSAYLLELRDCPSSQAKPKGLPDLPEIILDLPITGASRRANTAALDFTPSFFQPSGNMRNAPPIGGTNSRNRQRPDLIPQRIIKSVSLQDSVKPLHQSEKPWKPTTKQLSAGEIAEKRKTLESGVLFIMNRLTPTNFERLADEMKLLDIHTYEDLQELVKIFFDKVTIETKFVEAYAQLCKVMSSLKVPPPPNSNIRENQATFRVVMLTKCQQEFEADKTSIFEDPEEKRKKMEAELPEGPERDAKIDSTLYQMKMRRLKFYGNIRFIGELFKLHMLTENIMHDCIYRLLRARDDDSLLSLCNLIATVGRDLDTEKSRAKMDRYFAEMANIADESKSRIKFTLKDVIDLRKNNWVPRKEQTGPKKIQDVHKDFQQEQATKQFLQSQPLPPRTEPAQPNNRRGNRPRQDDKQVNDDGWNTVGVKVQRIDASKMRLSKSVVDENSIQLGPGGGMKQFSMWTRGSSAVAQPAQDSERPAANRFSALRGEEDRRGFQRSPSRGESGATPARGTRQGPTAGHGRGKVLPRSSQEGDRRDSGGRSMQGGRSQNSSRDNSWNREDRRQPVVARGSREGENPMTRSTGSIRPSDTFIPPTVVSSSLHAAAGYVDGQAVKRAKPLSEEEMEHKAKTILEEYLSAMDLEEAKLCVKELEGQTHISLLVTTSINDVLEKTHRERDLAGSFLHEIVKHGLLPLDVYLKGLSEVLSFAEDMVIDIPKIWTYLAQIIVPMLVGGSLSWPTLAGALKSSLDRKCCVKLVSEILLVAREKTSEREVAHMWQASNMTWSTFLETGEVVQFLRDKKLQFTLEPVVSVAVSSQINVEKLVQDVESIVRRDGTNDEVIACIDKHAGSDRHDKHFIRSVVAAVVNAAISPTTKKLKEDVLKSRKEILQHYIKNKAEMELQALYAIQALMHKLEHPSGVIASIFDILYDEEVISEETFKQWEKSSDPQEAEGKGACSMQLTQFFTWLRENEEPEGS